MGMVSLLTLGLQKRLMRATPTHSVGEYDALSIASLSIPRLFSYDVHLFDRTPDYLAPEVIRGTGHDWAVDYWALGIFLFELTNGLAPFYATNQSRRTRKILKGYGFVDVPPHFSRGLKDLIALLLENDPARRLGRTQAGIQAIKKHIFFAGFDWTGVLEKTIDAPIKPDVPTEIK
jgi:serine/threonine protein kinase